MQLYLHVPLVINSQINNSNFKHFITQNFFLVFTFDIMLSFYYATTKMNKQNFNVNKIMDFKLHYNSPLKLYYVCFDIIKHKISYKCQ